MKSIVIYYSYGGNTRKIAKKVADVTGADLAEIDTVKPYTGSYNEVVDQGQREVNRGFCQEIKPFNVDLKQYDSIILGTPVWWYTFAPAMNSFLQNVNLSGKSVYPFATNGGWIGHTFEDFEKKCKNADVHAGLNVRFNEDRQITSDEEVIIWAKQTLG